MYAPCPSHTYKAKTYDLHGLEGISDQTLAMHFKLYEGYVDETNRLTDRLRNILLDGKIDSEEMLAYSELKRRLGFEYNGMLLHEYYFDNLQTERSSELGSNADFRRATEKSFGTFEAWKVDFTAVGAMRGVGWAVCALNPYNGILCNHWITLHESGNIAGFVPVVVMDVWEHAFILDHKPSERDAYIDSFFAHINWTTLEHRLRRSVALTAIPTRE